MDDLTKDVAHRPWPLPGTSWVMAQRWNDLLFAHWPVETATVRALVPSSLTIDRYEQTAWITVTPFYLSDLHARGLPALPWGSQFAEINVRTYVTLGGKPGVWFFSLDAASALAVTAARAIYHLPYYRAAMDIRRADGERIQYSSRRTHDGAPPAEFVASYEPSGDTARAEPGSLDHWLTERYCLYAMDASGRLYRAEIHHRPWPLQPARMAVDINTMARAARIELPDHPPRLSFAHKLDVIVWAPERVGD